MREARVIGFEAIFLDGILNSAFKKKDAVAECRGVVIYCGIR